MPDRTQEIEERVELLERAVHRLLLVIGAAGSMLADVRHAAEDAR
jgi:putative NADH-flavin reductase